jgi:predicted nucleic acid-binding protein
LIFLDTNVVSETLRKTPDPAVIAWLVRNDAELALPTVTIAEIAFGIGKILATRNLSDFATTGLELVCPWDF